MKRSGVAKKQQVGEDGLSDRYEPSKTRVAADKRVRRLLKCLRRDVGKSAASAATVKDIGSNFMRCWITSVFGLARKMSRLLR